MSEGLERRLGLLEDSLLQSIKTQEDIVAVVERLTLLLQRLLSQP